MSTTGDHADRADSADVRNHLDVIDLGTIAYEPALAIQRSCRDALIAARKEGNRSTPGDSGTSPAGPPPAMTLLLLEHVPPVITVSRRPGARDHLIATPAQLDRLGIEVCETDRGGDITYHGPGQLVGYPILDLNRLRLGLHTYMRLLEAIIIRVLDRFGIAGRRDNPAPTGVPAAAVGGATGVWVDLRRPGPAAEPRLPADTPDAFALAKVCALGVRVSKWVTMHGFALNITTNLDHFRAIVPCGLAGRPVTSLEQLMSGRGPDGGADPTTTAHSAAPSPPAIAAAPPSMEVVKRVVAEMFVDAVDDPRRSLAIADQLEQAGLRQATEVRR